MELGGARLALPGLGSPQDRLPNPKTPTLPSTPKPTSSQAYFLPPAYLTGPCQNSRLPDR